MPLRLSNEPEAALAQEWLVQLIAWSERHGLEGYDPFDIKAHPLLQAAQQRPLVRKATTAACDLFPHLTRKVLRIPTSWNPKTAALMALGYVRLYEVCGDAALPARADVLLTQLMDRAVPNGPGLCWGYPFPVRGMGVDTPAGTPVAVVSAIAGEAFAALYHVTGEEHQLDACRRIADFLLTGLPRIPAEDGTWCFGYTPCDRRPVHNANLLAVEHLARVARITGDQALWEEALPALRYTLNRRRDDGAWTYGVQRPGDPFEPALMALIDHHHSGYVLRSLCAIHAAFPDPEIRSALEAGWRFYRKLILPSGMPVGGHARWPVDIHACAEGILCPSVLAPLMPGALRVATNVMRWTHYELRDPKTGAPWYRKYPLFRSRIVFPRWGVAWMFRALAEYLRAACPP